MNDHRNPFAQRFRDHSVKIAIVDNGVDKIRTTLSANIEKGRSFVYHGIGAQKRWLPWWVVADPHGTQMASLIQRVNPYCRLYIARVGEGRKDIRPSSAAKVTITPRLSFNCGFMRFSNKRPTSRPWNGPWPRKSILSLSVGLYDRTKKGLEMRSQRQ